MLDFYGNGGDNEDEEEDESDESDNEEGGDNGEEQERTSLKSSPRLLRLDTNVLRSLRRSPPPHQEESSVQFARTCESCSMYPYTPMDYISKKRMSMRSYS